MGCRPLGECIESVIDHRGLTPKKLGGDWAHSGHRALSAKNIKNGALVQEGSMNRVSDEMYYRWMTEEVERGDVFITSEAPFGEVLYWDSDEKLVLSQRIFGLKVNRDVCDSRYLYYWMRSPFFQGELRGRATGTTVTGLRQPELLKCMVHLPPRDVQAAIAHILGTIDDKIMFNNQTNGYLSELCDAVYANFIREKRGIDWHDGTLSELIEIKYGKAHKNLADGPYPVYGSGGYMRSVEKPLSSGESVLIPRKGSLNHVMYVDEDFWTVDTMFFTIPRMPGAAKYAYQYVKGLDLASMNAGSAVPSVTVDILNGLQLAIPCKEALDELDSELQPTYSLIAQIRAESKVLVELRDSLLPKLMSGEIDTSKIDLTQLNSHLSDY